MSPHRDLIWSSQVCLEWLEETEQTETKSRRTGNVSKMLQEQVHEGKSCFKRKGCSHQMFWFSSSFSKASSLYSIFTQVPRSVHNTVFNIWSGSKHFIKVVLKPRSVLVLGQLWFTFLIHLKCWLFCMCVYLICQHHLYFLLRKKRWTRASKSKML